MAGRADALVLFGVSGDLARKKLFSSLYALASRDRLDIPVIGVAATDWDDERLRRHARDALDEQGVEADDAVFDRLAAALRYVAGDYRDPQTYQRVAERLGDAGLPVAYLAIPPDLFDDVAEGLATAGLNCGRVVLEKPFGRDLASARELNELLSRHYPEDAIYRIDHFLGKEELQNLMVVRFSNTILEPIWNRHYIDHVQITMAEDFGVEGRGGFYDAVGTLRDVVQNHLLQMIALLAMEPPVSEEADALRDERAKVLKAVRSLDTDAVVVGQYDGYRNEDGVGADSETETYVAVRFEINSWRWAGVPWYVRAGKRLATTVTEAVVVFKAPPRPLFADPRCAPRPNTLQFRMKPDGLITLTMEAKKAGEDLISERVPLVLHRRPDAATGPEAYERLLDDALDGDPRYFARADGVEESWRIVQPVVDARGSVHRYAPGSWGPEEADKLLGGRRWLADGRWDT